MEGEQWVRLALYLLEDPQGRVELLKIMGGLAVITFGMLAAMGTVNVIATIKVRPKDWDE